jgi:hypothetical protein
MKGGTHLGADALEHLHEEPTDSSHPLNLNSFPLSLSRYILTRTAIVLISQQEAE